VTNPLAALGAQLAGDNTRSPVSEPPVYEFGVAQRYAIAGEKDLAFEWLEKVYEERHPVLTFVNIMPAFEDLRSDARFKDLLRRMGLPQ